MTIKILKDYDKLMEDNPQYPYPNHLNIPDKYKYNIETYKQWFGGKLLAHCVDCNCIFETKKSWWKKPECPFKYRHKRKFDERFL